MNPTQADEAKALERSYIECYRKKDLSQIVDESKSPFIFVDNPIPASQLPEVMHLRAQLSDAQKQLEASRRTLEHYETMMVGVARNIERCVEANKATHQPTKDKE